MTHTLCAEGSAEDQARDTIEILQRALSAVKGELAPPNPAMAVPKVERAPRARDDSQTLASAADEFNNATDAAYADDAALSASDEASPDPAAAMPEIDAAVAAIQGALDADDLTPYVQGGFAIPASEPLLEEGKLRNLKITELKELLRERDLPVTGRKMDLIERLLATETPESSSVDDPMKSLEGSEDGEPEADSAASADGEFVGAEDFGAAAPSGAVKSGALPDFESMKVSELKEACRERGLKVTGPKAMLIGKLLASYIGDQNDAE